VNEKKFEKTKEEILDEIREKLRLLLNSHGLKLENISWHTRSAEMLQVLRGHGDHVMDMCK